MSIAAAHAYKGWDVHSYTSEMANMVTGSGILEKCASEYYPIWSCRNPFSDDVFFECWREASSICTSPESERCLSKFRNYWHQTDGGWKDGDLGNINVAWLFCCAVKALRQPRFSDPSIRELFKETLSDIGGTCIQGDSHRLLFFLFGIHEIYSRDPE